MTSAACEDAVNNKPSQYTGLAVTRHQLKTALHGMQVTPHLRLRCLNKVEKVGQGWHERSLNPDTALGDFTHPDPHPPPQQQTLIQSQGKVLQEDWFQITWLDCISVQAGSSRIELKLSSIYV